MADVYVDMDLASGLNDGTSWANAYQSLITALNGSNAVSGDDVWVKGSETTTSAITFQGGSTKNHPVRVFGVKAATTNEPPVQSDLIPGWRTGEARTEANLAYNDGALPSFTNTSGSADIACQKHLYIYALDLDSSDNLISANSSGQDFVMYEECRLACDGVSLGAVSSTQAETCFKNCHLVNNNPSVDNMFTCADNAVMNMYGGKVTAASAITGLFQITHNFHIYGVDLSDQAHTILNLSDSLDDGNPVLSNCKLNASSATVSGTRTSKGHRVEMYGCSSVTGKTSGTIKDIEIATDAGDIVEETTAIRTGGAADSDTGWALGFTPHVDGTRDQYHGLTGPWMAFPVVSTDTTVTVYIANSGAADYNDDDVYLEVMTPSDVGTAQHSFVTTQMDLLATPSAVTDDTGSTWGTGANNHQKLEATIAPDFDGIGYCRVVFSKNFSSSPETLYVDPLPETS